MSYKSVTFSKSANTQDKARASMRDLRDMLLSPDNFDTPDPDSPMGIKRAFITALTITFGLFMVYVALHYVPAHFRSQGVVGLVTENGRLSQQVSQDSEIPILGDYLDAFNVRRTYLKAGQTLEARFIVPENTTLALRVRQCRSVFGLEVFHCFNVSEDSITIRDETYGRRTLTASRNGFYHFDELVTTPEIDAPFKVVWARR